MSNTVKITVIKKTLNTDLLPYTNLDSIAECPHFKMGDTFTCTTNDLPEGFCAWAFGDIAKDFALVAYDSTKEAKKVTCCTSGMHNVYFLIESVK